MASHTGSYTRDPRVDRVISWTLTACAAVALAVGAYFFRDLNHTVRDLSMAVSDLKTEVKVARVERQVLVELKADLKALAVRVRALETK